MLQALNILENADLKAMGYNSPKYIHTLYQAMNLAYADRDFYYGDPYFPPAEPVKGLLSKEYAKARVWADQLDPERFDGQAGRPVSVSGRDQSIHPAAGGLDQRSSAGEHSKAPLTARAKPRRHR